MGTSIYGGVGSRVTLPCSVEANPSINGVWWTYQQRTIDTSQSRYRGGTTSTPSLIISNVNITDGGYYTCHARNDKGDSAKSIELLTGSKL